MGRIPFLMFRKVQFISKIQSVNFGIYHEKADPFAKCNPPGNGFCRLDLIINGMILLDEETQTSIPLINSILCIDSWFMEKKYN
jgi:hypothetical protein